ncbi:MAG: hypothetical protein COV36_08195 [Alphaproteobacteria bacterium CG11_big_fil_rev_8_21_14_0_20_44_7]|nr:MAG: hypothetical protein COV36_08195 [Alphaproteobacteria bacterium CG11_big_fil_rev_8_21_14_0_20_44_7]
MRKGFTFIEISFVVVIIGILIGGMVFGSELVKTSRLQGIIVESQDYIRKVREFNDKYGYYPGDMPNASSFWDVDAATLGEHNGNGDGVVDDLITAPEPDAYERFMFWQHLNKAGYIDDTMSGAGSSVSVGVNVPESNYPKGIYDIAPSTGDYMILQSSGTNSQLLEPQAAFYIDDKMDDGIATTGLVHGFGDGGSLNCYLTTVYEIASTDVECYLGFYIFDVEG